MGYLNGRRVKISCSVQQKTDLCGSALTAYHI
ncbi:rev protein [Simian immunodeficiency virus]|uniref:Rev protein n=1 Tax=Simian immunodeficiency virus TaxID=11723 RepID=B7FCA7_SIV|nr:rev protein [Simian immunodeficiency virus]